MSLDLAEASRPARFHLSLWARVSLAGIAGVRVARRPRGDSKADIFGNPCPFSAQSVGDLDAVRRKNMVVTQSGGKVGKTAK